MKKQIFTLFLLALFFTLMMLASTGVLSFVAGVIALSLCAGACTLRSTGLIDENDNPIDTSLEV